jgi:hypothetical protein
MLLLFLSVLFDYVLYASLVVCKRPSIALGTVLWHLPYRLCVMRFNVSGRCLMLFIILVVCGWAMGGCLRFCVVMVFSNCVFLSLWDILVLALNMIKADQSYNCLILIMIIALAGHDTSLFTGWLQTLQGRRLSLSGAWLWFRVPFGNNCRDICNGTKPDGNHSSHWHCNTHYSWHIDTKPHW